MRSVAPSHHRWPRSKTPPPRSSDRLQQVPKACCRFITARLTLSRWYLSPLWHSQDSDSTFVGRAACCVLFSGRQLWPTADLTSQTCSLGPRESWQAHAERRGGKLRQAHTREKMRSAGALTRCKRGAHNARLLPFFSAELLACAHIVDSTGGWKLTISPTAIVHKAEPP